LTLFVGLAGPVSDLPDVGLGSRLARRELHDAQVVVRHAVGAADGLVVAVALVFAHCRSVAKKLISKGPML
jgi:hypothetical protein